MSFAESLPEPTSTDIRLNEAHHRIANDLAVIASMVRLQALSIDADRLLTPEEARTALNDAASRVDAVARLHRTLCSGLEEGGARAFLQSICRDAASFASGAGARVECQVDLKHELAPERLRSLGLLVHEMVLNALKHAHPAGVAGFIEVRVDDATGALAVDVSDDGVGFPDEFDASACQGFGFRMMRELARQLDALLAFESTPLGLTCRLRSRRSK